MLKKRPINPSYKIAIYLVFAIIIISSALLFPEFTSSEGPSNAKLYIKIDNPISDNVYPSNLSLALNFSIISDHNLNSCWYTKNNGISNTTISCVQNTTINVSEGNTTLHLYAKTIPGTTNLSAVNFSTDLTPPSISIISPPNNSIHGTNITLSLNFSASDINLNSCWYHIDSQDNITLPGCSPSAFNISEGAHILKLYANDSVGNKISDITSFAISVGSPGITLLSPSEYSNSSTISFKFIPSDLDLASCNLQADFNSTFSVVNTTTSLISGQAAEFISQIQDGSYIWNIKCTDLQNHSSTLSNASLTIDTIPPELSISEPSGQKSNRLGINISFSINETHISSCWFKVRRDSVIEKDTTFLNCSSGSGSFDVTIDADFTFELDVNDSSGNTAVRLSNFTVTQQSSSGSPGTSSGGGSNSDSEGSIVTKKSFSNETPKEDFKITLSDIGEVIVQPGEKKTLLLQAKNEGKNFLNRCKLSSSGSQSSWITSPELKNINPGELSDFLFILSIPESIQESQSISLKISCLEKEAFKSFSIKIQNPSISAKIISIEKAPNNQLLLTYSINSKFRKSIPITFRVQDELGEQVYEKTEQLQSLNSNENRVYLDVSKAGQGMLKVSVISEGNPLIEEYFLYGGSITGFASLLEINQDKAYISLLLIAFSIIAILLIKRIYNLHKVKSLKKSVIIKHFSSKH